jgi:branched-chain amino acid transport system ATP-binding protein
MLNVRAIDTYYGESQVLFGVSLHVGTGEIVALLGPSGAGKTTTLRVPDDRRVFPTLTAARNLSIARGSSPFPAYSTEACCEIFPALRNLLARECENMSGGELQMVSISRALAGGPGLVLFDEPSQGLAPKVVQDVMRTIRSLREQGVGALVVDQNVRTVLDIADRVYVMHAGRIVHEGKAAMLRSDDAARRALGLTDVS